MRVLYLSHLAAISRETAGFKFCLNQYSYVCFIYASSGGSGGTYNCTLSQKHWLLVSAISTVLKSNVLAQLYMRNMGQCIMVGTYYLLNYQL